ncbi:MAG: MFS transporter [Thermoplasmatales archaeon]|nr:MAG: MFS transporter [Thermoplasmatales archaeon]
MLNNKVYSLNVMFQSLLFISVGNLIEASYSPLDKIIKDHFLIDSAMVGLLTSVIFIGLVTVSPFVGYFVDHLGSFRAIKIAFLIMAIGSTLATLAPNFYVFVTGFYAIGLGYGLVTPATNNAVMRTYYPYHAIPMGIKQSGVPIGASTAAILLPLISIRYGFFGPFIILAIIAFIFFVIIRGENYENASSIDFRGYVKEIKGAFRNGRFILINVLVAAMSWGQQSLLTYSVLFTSSIGFKLFTAEILLASILIGSFIGRILWASLSNRLFPNRRILSLIMVMILSSLFFFIYSFLTLNFYLAIGMSFILGLTAIGWNGVYITVISEIAPRGKIGLYSGLGLLIISFGTILGTPFSGFISDYTHEYSTIWQILAAGIFAVSILLLIFSGKILKKKDESDAEIITKMN